MWNIDLTYREKLQPSFNRLYEKKALLHEARPLPKIALQKIQEALSVEWTYNSNSIEGNTLTLQETQLVLQEGITIKGKSLREHFEAKNHELALQHLYKLIKSDYILNASDILDLHRYVLRSIEEDYAGRLRTGGVRISGANFVPPNARKVPDLLDELIQFVLENPLQLNDIELATVFHHKFVWIHPFFDGNGRTVRLAMNLLLLKVGFTPAIILSTDRKKYYTALNAANKGNYHNLSLLMVQALERTMNIYIGSLPDNDMGFMEISNLVKEESLPYGQEYISLLARQGKIDAYKEGRNWLTTKDAVMEYISNRERKRVL
ncbi:Fic family protein [Psychroflexus planctonicus]|uniref:Cell division protein Fic n=1 Tax=Psychroflexus planctonicus TaxID=1526575 RepID=A0ABQ1SBP9_9FLAO|nr:Fic family protein [Psychroflexus planctonicus]GGE24820.1 cell division protein Fic [Psychroflexus planctonicus]